MRPVLLPLIIGVWALAGAAQAQTAGAPRPAGLRGTPAHPAAAQTAAAHPTAARRPPARAAHASGAPRPSRGRTPAAAGGGATLTLRTTDITGNKELPKVMVIVPWKGPAEAGGVVPPTDSLIGEVLGPVDRGVFQRRIRYYGQLDGRGRQAVAAGSENGVHKP